VTAKSIELPPPVHRVVRAVRRIPKRWSRRKDEHFVPSAGLDLGPYLDAGDRIAVHHLIRYHWAIAALQGRPMRRLIDVACGAGYGSAMLADAFPDVEVLGVDYDEPGVADARARYRRPNLSFLYGDAMRWTETIGAEPFDCVVSFDTLEHVPHREVMLMNIVDHLGDDGALLFSTPCGPSTTKLEPEWSAHRIEYSRFLCYDVMSRYFGRVLHPADPSFPALDAFDVLKGTSVGYAKRMNPLLCLDPIRVAYPTKGPGV
jgi:2-polyprenyl-3-methyl-5-hydroxy-6-metoxy-1,4-benzoquinol methylase